MLFNKPRALEMMERHGLDAVVASFRENVAYLSDVQSFLPGMYRFLDVESFALFARDPGVPPAVVISSEDAAWGSEYDTWIGDVYLFGKKKIFRGAEASEGERRCLALSDKHKSQPRAADALLQAIRDRWLERSCIGLDEKSFRPPTLAGLKEHCPNVKWVEAFEFFRVLRTVKTPEELDRLRVAAEVNERAREDAFAVIREGVVEEDILAAFRESTAKRGAVIEFWNSGAGYRAAFTLLCNGSLFPACRYRMKKGDVFRFDGGSIWNLYHSDTGATAIIGGPTPRQKTCYGAIKAGMDAAMNLLRPGAKASDVYASVVSAVEKSGLPHFGEYSTFCGHGIGIEARDYPIFVPPMKTDNPFLPGSYDIPLEKDMVVNIEVPYRETGVGGFQIEYSFRITATGCELLIPQKRELEIR